ncbi:hypothetical protein Scep_007967 [Stephania cephalantha]|uniref:N-acetyltransferase domain-containing protein n=1 Tax=Stephania cephalantha TaxID=152367 RepID=A0AAP0KC32_9MAGN
MKLHQASSLSSFTSQRLHNPMQLSVHGIGNKCISASGGTCAVSAAMNVNIPSHQQSKGDQLSLQLQKPEKHHDLRLNRLQNSDQGSERIMHRLHLGEFAIKEALLEEEYWAAAWLRAESHWEDKSHDRYVDSYKRKFADQEFNALKRRCIEHYTQKCTCIVAVKEESIVKHTTLKNVVGTLDLSIRHLLHGETFPGVQSVSFLYKFEEHVEVSTFSSVSRMSPERYGYIANLCVAQLARRNGIATNLVQFAIKSAVSNGVRQVFVHVHRENMPAKELYRKMGFQIVEMATSCISTGGTFLLCLQT